MATPLGVPAPLVVVARDDRDAAPSLALLATTDRPVHGATPDSADLAALLRAAAAVLVVDGGRGLPAPARTLLERAARLRPLVWHDPDVDSAPVPGTTLVVLDAARVRTLGVGSRVRRPLALARAASRLALRWGAHEVAVRLENGTTVFARASGACSVLAPSGDPVDEADAQAATRFAAGVVAELADGSLPEEAVRIAHAAAAIGDPGGAEPQLVRPSLDPQACTLTWRAGATTSRSTLGQECQSAQRLGVAPADQR